MPRKRPYSELQLLNPLSPPDWRSRRVNQILRKNNVVKEVSVADDAWTRKLLAYTVAWRQRYKPDPSATYEHLFSSNPDLAIAFDLRQASLKNPSLVTAMEARLLANQPFDKIGAAIGASPQSVEWYERCWFAVRDRLKQHDWIMNHVIVPGYQRTHEIIGSDGTVSYYNGVARPFVSTGIKLLSYRGGPAVCDFLLEGVNYEKMPGNAKESEKFIAQHAINTLTKRAAFAAEEVILHADNITEMFNVFARILEVQKRADVGGVENTDSKLIKAMHEVVDVTARQWFSRSVDTQQLALTDAYRYDGDSDELRSVDLADLAAGKSIGEREEMPPREPKPALGPDQLRDRLAGVATTLALFPVTQEGDEGDAEQ